MKSISRYIGVIAISFFFCLAAFPATNNSGNPPVFLWLDICSNGIGAMDDQFKIVPIMNQNTVDIGVDINADGSVDRWLSQESGEFIARDNYDEIEPRNWRKFLIRLDSEAGKKARIKIVDRSSDYYIAVKAIRLNYADGKIVPNGVPNGFFQEEKPLKGWTIEDGSITDPSQLIVRDESGNYTVSGTQFISTKVNGNQDRVTIVSDEFVLQPPTSFIYGLVSGGVSELWNTPGGEGSDNASGIYLDVGSATENPNGQYDEGIDLPLVGFYGRASAPRWEMHSIFWNTSGIEGRRAQIVAVDDSRIFHVGMDGWRMNWDAGYIPNGNFDEGIPDSWNAADANPYEYSQHPSGGIPNWTVNQYGNASVWYFDRTCFRETMSGRAYVGTGGSKDADRERTGVEIRSSVFIIQEIPDSSQSVFLQFASAQSTDRIWKDGRGVLELRVDINGNGVFTDTEDYAYRQRSQGMGWNMTTAILDSWHYPEYRFYIRPEHYGKVAQIYVEDSLIGQYAWVGVDDFFFWDGQSVIQPFPNADFEQGDLTNWTETIERAVFLRGWLSGSENAWLAGLVPHRSLNDAPSIVDGNFAADSADHPNDGGNGGDDARGTLTSTSFRIPSPHSSIDEWSIY